ncbi:DUF3857 domain-containing protein [Planctomycetota bacterium]
MRRLSPLVLLFAIMIFAVSCHDDRKELKKTSQAAANYTEDFSEGLIDRGKAIEAAQSVTRRVYPNSDDVLVDYHIRIQYQCDGTSVTWSDAYYKVLTEKGKKEDQDISFHFLLGYSKVDVKQLEIIKADGSIVPVDIAKQSGVMVSRGQMAMNIYNPNRKILKIGIPGLEIGDMVHYIARRETMKARVDNTWSDFTGLESTSAYMHLRYEVVAPEELPLQRIALKDEVENTVTFIREERDGQIHYVWEIKDVPRMYEEPNMPERYSVIQRLLVSTIPDWQTISSWYWNLCLSHLNATTPEMELKVKELTLGLTERQDKIEAIFKWVSQEVRYMGITTETGSPGMEPHDVSATFEKRHGVCRDKCVLLVAMLRLAGLEAFPVLINNGPKKDADVAQPYFNHAISCVREADGSYQLMDCTDENTKDIFPTYLCNKSYLVACPEGEGLLTSPIIPAEENLVRIETRGTLNAAGDLEAESDLFFEGINDNIYRGYFSRIKPEDRKRFFEYLVKRTVAGASLIDFEIEPENMLDTSQALSARLKYSAKGILVKSDDLATLPVPSVGTSVGMVNFIIGNTGLEKRKYPFVIDYACGVRESIRLDVGEAVGEAISMPEYEPTNNRGLSWNRTITKKGKRLVGNSEFLIKAVEFSPEEYLVLKETLKKIEYNKRKMLIFSSKKPSAIPIEEGFGPGVDRVIIKQNTEYELADANNWTQTTSMKMQIMSYGGKKKYSELKLNFNPAWEEIKLEKAVVTSAGKTQEISPEEINIMDAAWTGGAPRYPGGKTFVASLPAVEEGSIIEYRLVRRFKDHPFFSAREYFAGSDPIQEKTVKLITPDTMALTTLPDPTGAVQNKQWTEGGKRFYEWTIQNRDGIKQERSLPPLWSFCPVIFVSTGNWQDFGKKVSENLLNAASNQAAASAKAVEICADLTSAGDKLTAIRDFTTKSIRGAGPGLSALPLSCISNADTVLEDGYGNSADRAVVLFALLRGAGFKPEFVLASAMPLVEDLSKPLCDCPGASWFNTVLVKVGLDGQNIFLNDTNQYAILGATPHDGRLGLFLSDGRIDRITAKAEQRENAEAIYKIKLAANGDATITHTNRIYGTAFAGQRRKFAEMPPEELKRFHMQAVGNISRAARPVGKLVTDFDSYPGVLEFSVIIEKFAVLDGEYLYFTLPDSMANAIRVWADTREYPLYRAAPRKRNLQIRIELPAEFDNILLSPPEIAWQGPGATGSIAVKIRQDKKSGVNCLVYEGIMDLLPGVMPAAEYGKILDISRRLAHPEGKTVILGRSN